MSITLRRSRPAPAAGRGRPVRGVVATVLAVGATTLALGATGAPAQADEAVTDGDLAWGLSTYLNSSTFGRPNPLPSAYTAPATFDSASRVTSWAGGSGTVPTGGGASVAFDGTSVNFAPTSGAWLRLSEPQVAVDAQGNGTLSAVVSYGRSVTGTAPAMSYDPAQAPQRGPARVDLVDLAGNTAADSAVSGATTTWTGLDGAWAPEFTTFLAGDPEGTPAVPAWIYAGQVNGSADRTPSPLGFTVERSAAASPSVAVTTTAASPADGLTLRIDGTGFRAVTQPGDAGVYVGLAEAGEFPDTSQFDTSGFAAVDWIMPSRFQGDAWTTVLRAPTDKLDPSKQYAIFTWQAHRHSNSSQDTQTPVAIDFSRLRPQQPQQVASRVVASVQRTPTTQRAGSFRVRVTAPGVRPSGQVRLVLKAGSRTRKQATRPLNASGRTTWALPRLPAGRYKVVTVYRGSAQVKASRASTAFRVSR